MVYPQHFCGKCGSDQIRRNGHRQGHARYQCKVCRYQARFVPAAIAKAAQYAQVDQLLAERNSQRSIVRATGVSRRTIAGRLKKALTAAPCWPRLQPKKGAKKRWPALELDEMWTFVGTRKHKVWRWLAVERESRRIVAWVLGDRSRATARRLWQQLPAHWRGPRCWYFTDLWESYVGVLPRWQH